MLGIGRVLEMLYTVYDNMLIIHEYPYADFDSLFADRTNFAGAEDMVLAYINLLLEKAAEYGSNYLFYHTKEFDASSEYDEIATIGLIYNTAGQWKMSSITIYSNKGVREKFVSKLDRKTINLPPAGIASLSPQNLLLNRTIIDVLRSDLTLESEDDAFEIIENIIQGAEVHLDFWSKLGLL